jgi:Exonuclease VII, large subunit
MRRRTTTGSAESGLAPSLFDGSIADDEFLEHAVEVFPGASPRSAIAVSTLTQTVKDVVEGAFIPLWVRGEISDFKSHRNGHWYFALRDNSSQLRCVGVVARPARIPGCTRRRHAGHGARPARRVCIPR